jgi:hypothetical protein
MVLFLLLKLLLGLLHLQAHRFISGEEYLGTERLCIIHQNQLISICSPLLFYLINSLFFTLQPLVSSFLIRLIIY